MSVRRAGRGHLSPHTGRIVHGPSSDVIRLRAQFPQFKAYGSLAPRLREQLVPFYADYTTSISNDNHAISIHQATFLLAICHMFKPERILDTGSGFSSFVFRTYQRETMPRPLVVSVDDDSLWLERTREYLSGHGLSTEDVVDWDTFQQQDTGTFDLIFYDLGNMILRPRMLRWMLAKAAPGGFTILDDTHKEDYSPVCHNTLAELELKHFSLEEYTKDKYNRFSMLVTH